MDNHNNGTRQYKNRQQSIQTNKMDLFCSKVEQRIEDEKQNKQSNLLFQHNIQITPPNFNNYMKQQSREIFYRYSDWRYSPDLSRRLTPCDHQLYTELLSILDIFLRRHRISYMIMGGTLLGSYTHHDFLPWDDDVDLYASSRDRPRIDILLQQELTHTISISHINNEFGSYDRLYFPWSPKAGTQNCSYPFIDISYFDENSTHLWRANYDINSINDCSVSKSDIFPLVWRPVGQIWLPAPREPLIIFELLQWTNIDKLYYASNYSHKHERQMPFIEGHARPDELYPYYPWVKRYCLKTNCIEQLVITYNETNITIHTIEFEKYRMELFFKPKLENRTCLL